ncbi:UbiA prenyltransferase family protein [Candidatus Marinarcus aquaticus]|uniref:Uncharacterized protein n=1 Tax=Candidatus Marinarcus aquaticus TaxID=2044504 RepID=A0A4Q0XVB0_9BACT|nr:UbiA family prenyltransferase [Candidatus Marinarcus aquaticus]RXJ60119.1 hypothetical protein CRV04_03705 [Candidatus Marinarcus aquaticus]
MKKLLKFVTEYINDIKRGELTLNSFLLTFLCIVIIRTVLEFVFESGHFLTLKSSFYYILVDYVHIFISWLTLYAFISLILFYLTPVSFINTFKVTLHFFGIIIIVPILDYFVFESGTIVYNHSFDTFWFSFLNTFNPFVELAFATKGVRVEIALVLIFAYAFVYIESKKHMKALLSVLLIYTIIYMYGYLPAFYNFFLDTRFEEIINNSFLRTKSDVQFNLYIYLPLVLLLLGVIFKQFDKSMRDTIRDSIRIERFTIYLGLFLFGFVMTLKNNTIGWETVNLFDVQKVCMAALALLFMFAYSTVLNNIYDVEIDKISNTKRPLVMQVITFEHCIELKNFYLFMALLMALSINEHFFVLSMLILSLSYLYSAKPLRLKRHFIFANMTLSCIAVSVYLLGVTLFEGNLTFINSDKTLLVFIFVLFFISANIKDIKDIRGDKKEGVCTLPILLGEAKTMLIIKVSAFLCMVLFLYLLGFGAITLTALLGLMLFMSLKLKNSESYLLGLQLIALMIYIFIFLR